MYKDFGLARCPCRRWSADLREVGIDVSRSVPGYRPLSLSAREFALEELAADDSGAQQGFDEAGTLQVTDP